MIWVMANNLSGCLPIQLDESSPVLFLSLFFFQKMINLDISYLYIFYKQYIQDHMIYAIN